MKLLVVWISKWLLYPLIIFIIGVQFGIFDNRLREMEKDNHGWLMIKQENNTLRANCYSIEWGRLHNKGTETPLQRQTKLESTPLQIEGR